MTAAEIGKLALDYVVPVGTVAATWLAARATYRTSKATAKATEVQADTGKEVAVHEQHRADRREAADEWREIAEQARGDLKEAHKVILDLLTEKASRAADLARVDERLTQCETDRLSLHTEVDQLKQDRAEQTAVIADLKFRLERMENAPVKA